VMESFKPYKGGDNLLWALNKLRNRDDHRITCAIDRMSGGRSLDILHRVGPFEFGIRVPLPPLEWGRDKEELEILRVSQGDGLYRLTIATFLTFGDLDVIKGSPVQKVLMHQGEIVGRILDAVEAKAIEIGLFT
jgi:hypothetical protein